MASWVIGDKKNMSSGGYGAYTLSGIGEKWYNNIMEVAHETDNFLGQNCLIQYDRTQSSYPKIWSKQQT